MRTLDEYLHQAGEGGSVRSGMILGIRLTMAGLRALSIAEPRQHKRKLVAIVETDRCLPDAVELVACCRLGNRTLKFRDYGKLAATFVDLTTMAAVRVAGRELANARAVRAFPELEREKALQRAYQDFSDDQLLAVRAVSVTLAPEDIPGYWSQRVLCQACGEGVSFGKYALFAGRQLCRPCSAPGTHRTPDICVLTSSIRPPQDKNCQAEQCPPWVGSELNDAGTTKYVKAGVPSNKVKKPSFVGIST